MVVAINFYDSWILWSPGFLIPIVPEYGIIQSIEMDAITTNCVPEIVNIKSLRTIGSDIRGSIYQVYQVVFINSGAVENCASLPGIIRVRG
jgi:hypothetical protein